MNKDIKNYLHYYLGNRVKWGSAPSVMSLVGFDEEWVKLKRPKDGKIFTVDKNDRIKLYLRPLFSMTEEDLIGCLKVVSLYDLSNAVYESQLSDDEDFHGELFVNAYTGTGVVVDYYAIDTLKMQFEPEVFHYLISKGFDLFGLIPAGLAIDDSTLNDTSL